MTEVAVSEWQHNKAAGDGGGLGESLMRMPLILGGAAIGTIALFVLANKAFEALDSKNKPGAVYDFEPYLGR